MKVLVSNPSFENSNAWLPYLWGRLKSYCEFNDPRDFSHVEWLDPVFLCENLEDIVEPYDFKSIDILLISCYIWNWQKNIEIAQYAKEQNPDILIIAGGPQAQDNELFSVCDYVTNSDGEAVIADIIFDGEPRLDQKAPLSNLRSPYVEYLNDYKRFANQILSQNKSVNAIWETNRGCPYKCTFCDWGSATNSKIRRFDHTQIMNEIDAFGKIKVNMLFSADANYGIFKEDLEYAQELAKTKSRYGYPKTMFFSSAKNKKTITNAAAKVLYDSGMMPSLQISYQHTDEDVLSAIKRDNISNEKLKNELEEGFRNGIPLVGVVIMGNPNDTVDKWKKGIGDLLDIGFHEDIRYHDFMILPNAPAADPEYMREFGIKTITRNYNSKIQYHINNQPNRFPAEFISATNTFDEDDMVEIQAYTAFVAGFHVLNVTRYIAMYLKHYHSVSYNKFYDLLLNQDVIKYLYEEIKDDIDSYIFGDKMDKNIQYKELMVPHDFYIKIQALLNMDAIMDNVKSVVASLTDLDSDQIDDLISTQKRTIVGWWKQEDVTVNHNFIEAFANVNQLPPNTKPKEWELKQEKTILSSNQDFIGDQLPIRISEIDSFDSWLYSPIHRGENIRNKMNHYQEIFNDRL